MNILIYTDDFIKKKTIKYMSILANLLIMFF